MGQLGSMLGELIMIIGGLACFIVFGGYYMPKFKTEKEQEKHLELIKNKGTLFKTLGMILAIIGVFRLVTSLM